MNEAKIIKLINDQNEENRRYQKMLLEEFTKNNRIIAEQQVEHTKQLKNITKILDKHTKEIKRNGIRFNALSAKTDELSTKTDALMEMVASNTEDLSIIKDSLKRKVNIEEFEILVKRVAILETKVKSL